MSRVVFLSIDQEADRSTELKVSGDLTWHELSEEFYNFLIGCGYILSREDFAEYWSQHLPQPTITVSTMGADYAGGETITLSAGCHRDCNCR